MSRPNRRVTALTGAAIALVAAPIAVASPIQGGQRNPRSSNTAYSKQTQVWAANSAYALRVSNLGTGGAVIDGCRNVSGGPRASGRRPEDRARLQLRRRRKRRRNDPDVQPPGGTVHDERDRGGDRPERELPAGQAGDRLPRRHRAGRRLGQARRRRGQWLRADESPSSAATRRRISCCSPSSRRTARSARTGASASALTGDDSYTVTFTSNVSKCSYTASPTGPALATGSIGVGLDTNNPDVVDVNPPAQVPPISPPLPQGFHLQVIC